MAKDRLIVVRVDEATKRRLEEAAQREGKTMTTFVTEAAEREVRRVERRPPRGRHGGVPTYFRANCAEALRGGDTGYDQAGWHLAIHIADSEKPDDVDVEEWADQIDALAKLLDDQDDHGAIRWFEQHYPKCMALVPVRRRKQFLKGVYRAYEENRVVEW